MNTHRFLALQYDVINQSINLFIYYKLLLSIHELLCMSTSNTKGQPTYWRSKLIGARGEVCMSVNHSRWMTVLQLTVLQFYFYALFPERESRHSQNLSISKPYNPCVPVWPMHYLDKRTTGNISYIWVILLLMFRVCWASYWSTVKNGCCCFLLVYGTGCYSFERSAALHESYQIPSHKGESMRKRERELRGVIRG